jgi:hypothetical protein
MIASGICLTTFMLVEFSQFDLEYFVGLSLTFASAAVLGALTVYIKVCGGIKGSHRKIISEDSHGHVSIIPGMAHRMANDLSCIYLSSLVWPWCWNSALTGLYTTLCLQCSVFTYVYLWLPSQTGKMQCKITLKKLVLDQQPELRDLEKVGRISLCVLATWLLLLLLSSGNAEFDSSVRDLILVPSTRNSVGNVSVAIQDRANGFISSISRSPHRNISNLSPDLPHVSIGIAFDRYNFERQVSSVVALYNEVSRHIDLTTKESERNNLTFILPSPMDEMTNAISKPLSSFGQSIFYKASSDSMKRVDALLSMQSGELQRVHRLWFLMVQGGESVPIPSIVEEVAAQLDPFKNAYYKAGNAFLFSASAVKGIQAVYMECKDSQLMNPEDQLMHCANLSGSQLYGLPFPYKMEYIPNIPSTKDFKFLRTLRDQRPLVVRQLKVKLIENQISENIVNSQVEDNLMMLARIYSTLNFIPENPDMSLKLLHWDHNTVWTLDLVHGLAANLYFGPPGARRKNVFENTDDFSVNLKHHGHKNAKHQENEMHLRGELIGKYMFDRIERNAIFYSLLDSSLQGVLRPPLYLRVRCARGAARHPKDILRLCAT